MLIKNNTLICNFLSFVITIQIVLYSGYAYGLSPKTVLDKSTKTIQNQQLEEIIRMIYPHFDFTRKENIFDFYRPMLNNIDPRLFLQHLFSFSSDGFSNLKPYTYWDADIKNTFPKTVDKSQWLVISSKNPFYSSENIYNDSSIDSGYFFESIKVGDQYFAFYAPVKKGGKKKITIMRDGEENEIHYFKRENTKVYVEYTFLLLQRFKKIIKHDTKNILTNKLVAILKNEIGYKKLNNIFSDFDLDTRGTFTKTENGKTNVFTLKKNKFRQIETPYFSMPFKLINVFKRGRIKLSETSLLNLMLLDIFDYYDLENTLIDSLDEKEEKIFQNLLEIKKRLRDADLKNESDIRLLQLNARVKGQRPKDITDEQIQEWKNSGINMLYFMGVWETSPFSKEYNRYWGNKTPNSTLEREASAFAIKNYRINPEVATSAQFNNLTRRLENAGIKVMLDFVPNHMAMDNDYLPIHPEYFRHEDISDDNGRAYYIDQGYYDSFNPQNWPKHENGAVKYRIWYSKKFDEKWGSDHFLMQELDHEGRQVKVLKFYHGNWSWRDTVQIDYQNPKAREFMRKNAVKAAYRARGGGLRWDFVHVVLQKHFNETWSKKDFKDFLRKWKGVENIPVKSPQEWNNLFKDFLETYKYKPADFADEKARELLEQTVESFKEFLLQENGIEYGSLAPAFHFEGLSNVIKEQMYPKFTDEDYREIFDAIPNLRFHESIERTVNALKTLFPDIMNIAEAYEEEAYIHNLGIDAIYAADMHKVLVGNAEKGRSFFDSVHDFFNIARDNSNIWDMKNHVFYMQNFDEIPAIHSISPEDIIYKASLLYGLPGIKYFEWGLIEGNTNRLGADWIHPELYEPLKEKLKPFFTNLINISADDIIKKGTLQQIDLADNVRAYKRNYMGESISVVANIVDDYKQVPLNNLNLPDKSISYKLLGNNDQSYIQDGILYLAPKSVVWIKTQPKTESIVTVIDSAA